MTAAFPPASSPRGIGPLVAQDESFTHQIADTFGAVGTSDLGWSERTWNSLSRRDGSLQIAFGLGVYPNRGVLDGFAGCSRGTEQWTVRASRELDALGSTTHLGPIAYEVLEPMRRVRYVLDDPGVVDLAFDLVFDARLPPFFEERFHQRDERRVLSDLVRFHQCGEASGWVRLDGELIDVVPEEWVAFRDRSWGVRTDVGAPAPDLRPSSRSADDRFLVHWSPMLLRRPDGGWYEIHHHLQALDGRAPYFSGAVGEADGSRHPVARLDHDLAYEPRTRRLRGGTLDLVLATGETRRLDVSVVGETGFYLGTGLYVEFDGKKHGMWRGPLVVDGEHIPDCTADGTLRRVHQGRDAIVEVVDGEARGHGIFETVLTGAWPDKGLPAESSFL